MRILAIDTALPAAAACVLDARSAEPLAIETMPMAKGHAEALLPLIERVMARVEGGFASLDKIAATVGPGSFTGIRIGLAAARGVGLACARPVVGVSTLSALAAPLILESQDGVCAAAIDARHGCVFLAAFAPDGRTIVSPRLVGLHDGVRALGAGKVRIAGSGAPLLAAQAALMGVDVEIAGSSPFPDIAYVARLGLAADAASAPARPLYLKAPDVKPPVAQAVATAAP